MADPIVIQFSVGGIADVRKAFASVTDVITQLEQRTSQAANMGGGRRVAIARQESQAKVIALRDYERTAAQTESKLTQTAARESRRRQAEQQRGVRDALRNEEKKWRDASRYLNELSREKQREAASDRRRGEQEVRDNERKNAQIARQEQRLVAERERMNQRVSQQRMQTMMRFNQAVGGGVVRGLGNVAGSAMQYGGMALAVGGGLGTMAAISKNLETEKAAYALALSAYNPSDPDHPEAAHRRDPKEAIHIATAVEAETGIDKAQLIKGWQGFVAKTADYDKGKANLANFARLAQGTGTDFVQLMNAAGMLQVQNKTLTAEGAYEMMRNVVAQGKMGAVEISDLAHMAGRVASSAGQYADNQATAQTKLLGATQVAFRSAGSADEAATIVERFTSDFQAKLPKLMNAGILKASEVKDPATNKLKDPATIMSVLFEKFHGQTEKMFHTVFQRESIRMANAERSVYDEAYKRAWADDGFKGTDAQRKEHANKKGAEAVYGDMNRFGSARYTEEDVRGDLRTKMQSNALRLEMAFQKLRNILEEHATPFIERFVNALPRMIPTAERLIDALASLAQFIVDNPFKSVGAVVAASILKEMALAGIGQAVRTIFQMGAVGAGGGGGAGVASAMGIPGAAGAGSKGTFIGGAAGLLTAANIAITATSVAIAGVAAIEAYGDFVRQRENKRVAREAGEVSTGLHETGEATRAHDVGRMNARKDQLDKRLKDNEAKFEEAGHTSFGDVVMKMIGEGESVDHEFNSKVGGLRRDRVRLLEERAAIEAGLDPSQHKKLRDAVGDLLAGPGERASGTVITKDGSVTRSLLDPSKAAELAAMAESHGMSQEKQARMFGQVVWQAGAKTQDSTSKAVEAAENHAKALDKSSASAEKLGKVIDRLVQQYGDVNDPDDEEHRNRPMPR